MTLIANPTTASVSYRYAGDGTIANEMWHVAEMSRAWVAIDAELNNWIANPAEIVDDGATPPSKNLIRLARRVVAALSVQENPAPTLVVPDGNGGIALEWHLRSRVLRTLEFNNDGEAYWYGFEDGKLVFRRPFPIP